VTDANIETIPAGTSATGEPLTLFHNPDDRFYELDVDGQKAGILVYEASGNRRVFTHAYIYDGYRGRNLVTPLIASTFDDIRAHGATVSNFCPVIGHFLESHPDYQDVLDDKAPGTWAHR
jgi:uncharacterized protein